MDFLIGVFKGKTYYHIIEAEDGVEGIEQAQARCPISLFRM